MKYSKRQLNGLIASVNAWVDKYEGRSNDYGQSGCPLCKLYFRQSHIESCGICPIKLDTGEGCCAKTPYWIICEKKGYGHDIRFWKDQATTSDKLKELRYLISLLPKAHQKKYKKYMGGK
jgi:hypothetical protein